MPAIRWVCISDLHLGALNSVLTSVHPTGDHVEESSVSPVLVALCDAVRALSRGADPPQLVVLGDLFELALCSTSDAAATFAHLLEQLRPGTADAAVAPVIRFLPGNHDHHLWSRARGDCYVDYMANVPFRQPLRPEPHATCLLPSNDTFRVRDRIVELMAARADTAVPITVEQSYPNMGLVDSAGGRRRGALPRALHRAPVPGHVGPRRRFRAWRRRFHRAQPRGGERRLDRLLLVLDG